MTLTSSPPRRREVRQQSMAVLPPPSTITRRPIFSTWPKETLESQSMPMWMFARASWRPGMSSSRPRADEDRVIAFGQQRLQAVHPLALAQGHAEPGDVVHLLVDHRLRQTKARDLAADHAAGPGVGVDDGQVVAHRRQVARHRQRGGPGADQGDALAVLG